MFRNMLSDGLGALFDPLTKFLRDMLGIAILCGGGGGALTALALMDFGFPMLIVIVVCAAFFLVGVVMAPGSSRDVGRAGFSERLSSRRQLRKYASYE